MTRSNARPLCDSWASCDPNLKATTMYWRPWLKGASTS